MIFETPLDETFRLVWWGFFVFGGFFFRTHCYVQNSAIC